MTPPRQTHFFVNGAGIDHEVIATDICRYCGNDATVRPGQYTNPETGQVIDGYFIQAYRALSSAQLADLRSDSAKWLAEGRITNRVRASEGQSS